MQQMRRMDRKLSDDDTRQVLERSEYGFLATINEDGSPYCIPMNAALVGNTLYFHGAKAGHKLNNLRRDARACYSAVYSAVNIPAEFTYNYASCVATGTLREITDEAERMAAMRALVTKYSADFIDTPGYERTMRGMPAVVLFALEIESVQGKANKGQMPQG